MPRNDFEPIPTISCDIVPFAAITIPLNNDTIIFTTSYMHDDFKTRLLKKYLGKVI